MHLPPISGFVPRSYRRFIPHPLVVPLLSVVVWLASGLLYRTVLFLLLLQNEESIET